MHLDDEDEEKKVVEQEVEQEEEKIEEKEDGDEEEKKEEDAGEEKEEVEEEEDSEEKEAQAKKSPPVPEWMRKRLASYTKKAHDERRRADSLEAENTSLKKAVEALSAGRGNSEEEDEAERTVEDVHAKTSSKGKSDDKLIEERAEQIVATQAFNKACDELYDKGEASFGKDWGVAMGNINDLGGFRENPTALQIIMELPDSHKIVHALGKDPELADRIFGLKPVRMTVELTKLSDKLSAPKKEKISEVPDPVKTLRNGKQPKSEDLTDKDSTAEWMRKREAQVAEKG